MGLDLNYYWSLTPKQFNKHIKVFNEKEKSRLYEKDLFNHLLGKYIWYVFNKPKDYPLYPFLSSDFVEQKNMTDDEMEKQARRNTIKLGGTINDS